MKTETFLSTLTQVGKKDHPPRMNVVNQVMTRLQSSCLEEESCYDILSWTAVISTGVAVAMGVTAICFPHTAADPLLDFIITLPWGLL